MSATPEVVTTANQLADLISVGALLTEDERDIRDRVRDSAAITATPLPSSSTGTTCG